MKNKLLSLLTVALLLCATMLTANEEPVTEPITNFQEVDLNLNLNVGIEMKNAFDIAFEAMESGEPITFNISKLSLDDPEICCHPGCSLAYCCWKC